MLEIQEPEKSTQVYTAPVAGEHPQQFRIRELLWLMVLAALLMGLVSPFLRQLPKKVFVGIVIAVAIEVILLGSIVAFGSWRRKRLLDKSGPLIGLGNSGETQGKMRGEASSAFLIIYFLLMQGLGAVSFAFLFSKSSFADPAWNMVAFIFPFQFIVMPNMFLLVGLRFVRWGLNPMSVEFYSEGMALMDTLTPWDRLEIRRSQQHANRLAIVVTPVFKDSGKSTVMVWVDEALAEKLLCQANKGSEPVKKHSDSNCEHSG
jgi:hypothetical protein